MRRANLNLSQLRVLVSLEETGSFTVTAEKLRLTQPAISHMLRNLEEEVGTKLFERRREGTVPTAAGRLAVDEARGALIHIERLEYAVRGEAVLQTGRLRLGCFPSAANWIIPPALAEFNRRYPGVELEVHELADATCAQAVLDRRVDLAMVNLPSDALATFPLFEDELCVVSSERLWRGRNTLEIGDLDQIPFITPSGACEPLINAAFVAAGVKVRTAVTAISQDAGLILAMVREGMGVTIMPAYALQPERLRGLRIFKLKPRLVRRVAFAASSHETIPPAARAFLEVVTEKMEEMALHSAAVPIRARRGAK